MTRPVDPADVLETFTGRAPIFPLPNVVHFPHLLLPLHIFEPRYRRMVADSIAGDRMLAMALLKPGWEAAAVAPRPEVFQMTCLGRITAEHKLPDGRYHLVLQGLCRARILSEDNLDLPYRMARMELCPDRYPSPSRVDRDQRQQELVEAFRKLRADVNLEKVFREALQASVSMGVICDVLTDALKLPPVAAQLVLDAVNVDDRSTIVLERILEQLRGRPGRHARTFPPPFSHN